MRIPIRNVYYLLLYAWDVLEAKDDAIVGGLNSTQVVELFGRMLHESVTQIFRRGADKAYQPHTDTLAGLRGRIDLTPTLTRALLMQGRAVCTFDELTLDSLPNRVAKAAAAHILQARQLDSNVRDRMHECLGLLRSVTLVPLTVQLCRQVQLHQNSRAYRVPVAIAEMLASEQFAEDREGSMLLRDFDRSDGPMARVFEGFVRKFLAREQSTFTVSRPRVQWADLEGPPDDLDGLPSMVTDVVLATEGYAAVIETKYYGEPFRTFHGATRVRSAHLYQLYAYIRNLSFKHDQVDGVLLYAQVGHPWDVEVSMQGHRIRVLTLDLAMDWEAIHAQLTGVAEWARVGRKGVQPTPALLDA